MCATYVCSEQKSKVTDTDQILRRNISEDMSTYVLESAERENDTNGFV